MNANDKGATAPIGQRGKVVQLRPGPTGLAAAKEDLVRYALAELEFQRDVSSGSDDQVTAILRRANLRRELLTIGEQFGL